MILKYANKQLKRRPFMAMLIIFQFSAIIMLISMILTKLQGYFVISNLIKDVCAKDSYLVKYDISYSVDLDDRLTEIYDEFHEEMLPYDEQVNNNEITYDEYKKIKDEKFQKYEKIIQEENLEECQTIPDISDLPHVDKRFTSYESDVCVQDEVVEFLSTDYVDSLDFKMKSGCWISDAEEIDEYVNIAVFSTSNLKVGDIVDVQVGEVMDALKGKVVGVIDYSHYKGMIEHGTFESSRYISIDSMIQLNSYDVFMEYNPKYFEGIEEKCFFYAEPRFQLVKLKDDITEEERAEFFSVLTAKKLQSQDLSVAYENTYIRDKKDFQNDIIFLVIAGLIAIVSLIGMSALSVTKEIKTYSIYCLNGMTRNQCIAINGAYISLLVVLSTVLAVVTQLIYGYIG